MKIHSYYWGMPKPRKSTECCWWYCWKLEFNTWVDGWPWTALVMMIPKASNHGDLFKVMVTNPDRLSQCPNKMWMSFTRPLPASSKRADYTMHTHGKLQHFSSPAPKPLGRQRVLQSILNVVAVAASKDTRAPELRTVVVETEATLYHPNMPFSVWPRSWTYPCGLIRRWCVVCCCVVDQIDTSLGIISKRHEQYCSRV